MAIRPFEGQWVNTLTILRATLRVNFRERFSRPVLHYVRLAVVIPYRIRKTFFSSKWLKGQLVKAFRGVLADPDVQSSVRTSLATVLDEPTHDESRYCLSVVVAEGLGFKPTRLERFSLKLFDGVTSLALILSNVTSKLAAVAALNLFVSRIPEMSYVMRGFIISKIPDFLLRGVSEGDSFVASLSQLGALVCALPIMAQVLKGEFSIAQLERFYVRMRKTVESRADLLLGIKDTLTWSVDWGAYLLLGYDLPFGSKNDLKAWITECHSLIRAHVDLDKAIFDHGSDVDATDYLKRLLVTVEDRLDQGEVFLVKSKGKELEPLFRALNVKLQHLSGRIYSRLSKTASRAAPFTVLLMGTPGVGKSWATTMMMHQWAALTGKPYDGRRVYTRCAGDPFWSGYLSSSWGTVVDDLCCGNPKINPDTRVSEMIYVINNVPYLTPQGELEDKGNIPYQGEILVATSNGVDWRPYFSNSTALDRRFELRVTQYCHNEYKTSTGQIDSALTAGNEHLAFYYEVEIFDLKLNKYVLVKSSEAEDDSGRYHSLSQYQELVFKRMRKHIEKELGRAKTSTMDICPGCGVTKHLCTSGCESEEKVEEPLPVPVAIPVDERQAEALLKKAGKAVHDNAIVIGGVCTAITAVAGAMAVSRRFNQPAEHITPVATWDSQKDVPVTQLQKSTSPAAWQHVVAQNTWMLTVTPSNTGVPARCQALHLRDGAFVTVGHIFEGFSKSTMVSFSRRSFPGLPSVTEQQLGPIPLGTCQWRRVANTDAVLILPPNMQRDKGMIAHFLEHSSYTGGAVLHRFTSNDGVRHEVEPVTETQLSIISWPVGEKNPHYVIPSRSYPSQCGSPLVGVHDGGNFITGILCATCVVSTQSYVIPLTQHLLFQELFLLNSKPTVKEVLVGTYGVVREPFPDSVVNFQNTSTVSYVGQTKGNSTPKTHCCKTHLFDQVEALGYEPGRWAPPQYGTKKNTFGLYLNDISPIPVNVGKMLAPKPALDRDVLSVIVQHTIDSYKPYFTGSYGPLSLEEAINGKDSQESLTVVTSAGFPRSGNKLQFLDCTHLPNGRPWYSLNETMQAEFDLIHKTVKDGFSVKPVFKGTLKDEVVTVEKNAKGKVRMFLASPMAYTVLVRMYYLSFIRSYKECALKENAGHAYSMNHSSPQWNQLAQDLRKKGSAPGGAYGAGDFSNFDKGMGGQVIEASFEVMHALMGGANPTLRAIAADISYPYCSIRGDLISLGGSNPSGHPLTTVVNCIVNQLYHRYAYYMENGSIDRFNDDVFLSVFGDDSIFGSRDASVFSQRIMQKHMTNLGIVYTDANKSTGDIPESCAWEELTFLSRSFHPYGEIFVPLLNHSSIIRMVSWHSPKRSEYSELWQVQMSQAFWREYALYELAGREDELEGLEEVVGYRPQPLPDVLGDLLGTTTEVVQPVQESRIVGVSGVMDQGVLHFDDNEEAPEEVREAPHVRPIMAYNTSDGDSLGNFLSRPILVQQLTWPHGGELEFDLPLWDRIVNDPAVVKKLDNFSLIRANMRVRIQTNGHPFHYGLGTVAINPFRLEWGCTRLHSGFGIDQGRFFVISQAPGPLCPINPSTNPVVELYQEFVAPTDYISIADLQAGDALTPANYLHIHCDTLFTSNGVIEDVTLSIWAWLEDVELLVPTPVAGVVETVKSTIKEKLQDQEAHDDGAITQFTSAFTGAADSLSKLPFVGGYAKMAAGGLRTATKVFSFFGLSRPTEVGKIESFVPRPFGDLAAIYRSDTAMQLSLDPRAGITPEPCFAGVDSTVDQMSFAFLAGKASLFHSFTWQDADAVGTSLQSWAVHPMCYIQDGAGSSFALPPVGLVAYPFEYWRGSLEFFIVIVHSKFISGRVAVAYNPESGFAPTTPGNTAWTTIIDLDPTNGRTEVIINVPYSSDQHFKSVFPSLLLTYSTFGFIYNPVFFNGSLTMRVVNQLRSADGIANARVYLGVRGGSDFEVAVPSEKNFTRRTIQGVSGTLEKALGYDYETGRVTGPVIYLGGSEAKTPAVMSQVYIGEKVVSYRALIKRYCKMITLSTGAVAANTLIRFILWSVPPIYRTTTHGGTNSYAVGAGLGNRVALTPLNFISPCYAAYRGSMRFKCHARTTLAGFNIESVAYRGVDLYNNQAGPVVSASTQFVANPDAQGTTVIPVDNRRSGHLGALAQAVGINPVLDFSVPFYSRFKFAPPKYFLGPAQASLTDVSLSTPVVDVSYLTLNTRVDFDVYNAAGDDFDCVLFLCSTFIKSF